MRDGITMVGAALFTIACVIGVCLLVYAIAWVWAPWQGKLQARQQIQSGSNRIAEYDKFFNLCASVQINEDQYDTAVKTLASTDAPIERARIQQNMAGILGLRSTGIRQYNADSQKSYTDGQFRASNLPFQLSSAGYPEGGKTACYVN